MYRDKFVVCVKEAGSAGCKQGIVKLNGEAGSAVEVYSECTNMPMYTGECGTKCKHKAIVPDLRSLIMYAAIVVMKILCSVFILLKSQRLASHLAIVGCIHNGCCSGVADD
jgi:hypothetical protein